MPNKLNMSGSILKMIELRSNYDPWGIWPQFGGQRFTKDNEHFLYNDLNFIILSYIITS